jgi:PAS domain S-box-containing protein
MNHRNAEFRAAVLRGLMLASACLAPAVQAVAPPAYVGEYAHTSWTSRDGYSLGAVFAMAQTADGYLWLASEKGLVRFDGEKFTPWQPPSGSRLPNHPYSLLVTRDGTLWMGTYAGLASWNGAELVVHPALDNAFVTALHEDRDGTVWAAVISEGGKLCEVRDGKGRCHSNDGAFGEFVWSLAEDEEGALWVGADSGLWRWKPGPPTRYELPDRVGDLITTAQGLLVGIRGGGLRRFEDGKLLPYAIHRAGHPGERVADSVVKSNKLIRDREGRIWIGSDGRGLIRVHEGEAVSFSAATGLSGDIACSLFEDREGNIWFGSEKGLDRFRKRAVSTIWLGKGPNSEITKSVVASRDGSVWVSASEGISRWKDGQARFYFADDGLPATGGQALFEDSRGRIWVSTYNGLTYFERGKFFKVEGQPGNDVISITGDETDLWLSGPGDLARFRNDRIADRRSWTSLGLENRGSAVADRGGLWIGHWLEGGVLYLKDGEVRERYTAADGLGEGHVSSLRLDDDGTLWVATQSGLSRIQGGRVRTLTHDAGLPCDGVHWSIEDDQRNLWMNTSCGLVRVTREDLDAWLANPAHVADTKRWGAADGVPVRAVSPYYTPPVAKAADGKLWFVSGEGVQVADPATLTFNPIPPPVFVEQIIADRQQYPVATDVRLPPLVRDVTIEFTALSLSDAQSVQFRYRLAGHDTEWQEAGNRRQAFYMNLRPGDYRFQVTASNNNGVWNEEGTQLEFSIAPAYYQTTWFRLAWVVLVAALIAGGFLVHSRRVRREENRLRRVLEGIPTMAFSVHPDGSLDLVNQQWLDYSGLTVDAKDGRGWESAVHPDDVKNHLERWRAALTSGEPFENEARFRSAGGEYRWFLVRAVPLRDTQGKILKWYGALTDIEERRRAEEERERLRQLEAQLAHTNRVSMLGELTASIAHEINQPIGAAIASAGAGLRWLDRDQPALEQARESFLRIKDDSKRAADIIAGLRALYRKETSPQRELLDMNEVIREMLVLLRREAGRHAVIMRTELAPDLPRVRANRVQMQQVLMNLMVNGIEAMSAAGGELLIRTESDGKGIKVAVKDSGKGIPADQIEQIFHAFVTTKSAGSGMGLAISRTIVESHNGKLWAEANPGRGATFCFTLPAPGDAGRSQPPA